MQSLHTIALDLIQQVKKFAVTEDKSLVENDLCLRLFPHGDSRHYWWQCYAAGNRQSAAVTASQREGGIKEEQVTRTHIAANLLKWTQES